MRELKALRRELIDPAISEHKGRTVKTTGDGMLVEFASPVEAVRCASEIQKTMREREGSLPEDRRIEIRVGINLGDVIIDDDDVYGDGVNIAARLEALADPGGVVISSTVFEQVRDRVPDSFEDLGDQQVKNIARPVRVNRVVTERRREAATGPAPLPFPDKPSIGTEPNNVHPLRPRLDHHLRMLFRIGQLGEGAFHAPKPDMSRDQGRHVDPALGDVA